MQNWIVDQGDIRPYSPDALPRDANGHILADTYGDDWIVVAGDTEAAARYNAYLYNNNRHPAQVEMQLFARLFKKGVFALPIDPD